MTDRIEEIRARLARVAEGTCDYERTRFKGYTGPDPCDYDETWGCTQHDDVEDWREDVQFLLSLLPRWIPVTERLPEAKDHKILVASRWKGSFGYVYEVGLTASYPKCFCGKECGTITHWMPMWEPPKEGENAP